MISVVRYYDSYTTRSFSDCADTDHIIGCTAIECPDVIGHTNCNIWEKGTIVIGSSGRYIISSTICYCNTTLCNSSPTINISKKAMWTAFLLILSYINKVCGIFV